MFAMTGDKRKVNGLTSCHNSRKLICPRVLQHHSEDRAINLTEPHRNLTATSLSQPHRGGNTSQRHILNRTHAFTIFVQDTNCWIKNVILEKTEVLIAMENNLYL
jgi:hypothetical protein